MYVCMYVCMHLCMDVHICFSNIDMYCLDIFVLLLLSCRMNVLISG